MAFNVISFFVYHTDTNVLRVCAVLLLIVYLNLKVARFLIFWRSLL